MNKIYAIFFLLATALVSSNLNASRVNFCRFEARVVAFDAKTRLLTFRPLRLLKTQGPRKFCDTWQKADVKYTLKPGSEAYRPQQLVKAEYRAIYNIFRDEYGTVVRKSRSIWSFARHEERRLPFMYLDP